MIDNAKQVQLLDLVFPLIYAPLAAWCVAAAGAWRRAGDRAPRPDRHRYGLVAFAAAAFDYIENLGLAFYPWGDPASPGPQLARWWPRSGVHFTAARIRDRRGG